MFSIRQPLSRKLVIFFTLTNILVAFESSVLKSFNKLILLIN